jgi:hypothetical protein
MEGEESLLDEFKIAIKQKNESFKILLISFSLYILFVTLDFIFNIENFSLTLKRIDWQFTISILILPIIGLMLFIKKNKFGWAICLFYYMLVLALILSTFSKDLFKKEVTYFTIINSWRGFFMLLLSTLSILLLVSKNIREDFKITIKNFRTALLISLTVTIIMIAFIINQ